VIHFTVAALTASAFATHVAVDHID